MREWLVVSVVGELDLAASPQLAVLVREALLEEVRPVCIDLAGTTFIDSAGLSTLLNCKRNASRRSADLVVVAAPSGPIRRAIEIVRLQLLVPVLDAVPGQADSVELSITNR